MSKNTILELLNDNLNKHMEICDLKRKVKGLTAENERLRKAGDDLYKWAGSESRPPMHIYAAWNAAKEGGRK